jgi:hypothetical protein
VQGHVKEWIRDHPWQADGLLAALLFAFSLGQQPSGSLATRLGFLAVTAALAATVVPRRRYPVAAFAVAAAIVAAQISLGVRPGIQAPVPALQPNLTDFAVVILLYSLAVYRPRPVSIAGLALCLIGLVAAIALWTPANGTLPSGTVLGVAAGLGGAALAAWVLGDSVAYRYRRTYYASLEERDKLGLAPDDNDNRRVIAALRYLES